MKEIKSANDIIVVPVSYFNGMEKELQKILNKVDIHDMDVMEQVLHMRKVQKSKRVQKNGKYLWIIGNSFRNTIHRTTLILGGMKL